MDFFSKKRLSRMIWENHARQPLVISVRIICQSQEVIHRDVVEV